jgi:hypothetical protein
MLVTNIMDGLGETGELRKDAVIQEADTDKFARVSRAMLEAQQADFLQAETPPLLLPSYGEDLTARYNDIDTTDSTSLHALRASATKLSLARWSAKLDHVQRARQRKQRHIREAMKLQYTLPPKEGIPASIDKKQLGSTPVPTHTEINASVSMDSLQYHHVDASSKFEPRYWGPGVGLLGLTSNSSNMHKANAKVAIRAGRVLEVVMGSWENVQDKCDDAGDMIRFTSKEIKQEIGGLDRYDDILTALMQRRFEAARTSQVETRFSVARARRRGETKAHCMQVWCNFLEHMRVLRAQEAWEKRVVECGLVVERYRRRREAKFVEWLTYKRWTLEQKDDDIDSFTDFEEQTPGGYDGMTVDQTRHLQMQLVFGDGIEDSRQQEQEQKREQEQEQEQEQEREREQEQEQKSPTNEEQQLQQQQLQLRLDLSTLRMHHFRPHLHPLQDLKALLYPVCCYRSLALLRLALNGKAALQLRTLLRLRWYTLIGIANRARRRQWYLAPALSRLHEHAQARVRARKLLANRRTGFQKLMAVMQRGLMTRC